MTYSARASSLQTSNFFVKLWQNSEAVIQDALDPKNPVDIAGDLKKPMGDAVDPQALLGVAVDPKNPWAFQ